MTLYTCLCLFATFMLCAFSISDINKAQSVEWKGVMVYAEKDPAGAFNGYKITIDAKYEMGMRSDGVVVWREKK